MLLILRYFFGLILLTFKSCESVNGEELTKINLKSTLTNFDVENFVENPMNYLTREHLFWILLVSIAVLILLALCCYSCFVVRYRDYLKKRTSQESQKNQIVNPNFYGKFI